MTLGPADAGLDDASGGLLYWVEKILISLFASIVCSFMLLKRNRCKDPPRGETVFGEISSYVTLVDTLLEEKS